MYVDADDAVGDVRSLAESALAPLLSDIHAVRVGDGMLFNIDNDCAQRGFFDNVSLIASTLAASGVTALEVLNINTYVRSKPWEDAVDQEEMDEYSGGDD